jgi:subtilisin family serine protease
MDQMNFVPNEILVKFKDDVQLKSGSLLKSAGITAVDKLLQSHGAEGLEKLFPTETKLKSARVVKDPLGQDMVIPSLHNIYKIVLPQLKSIGTRPVNIHEVIEELKSMPEVEYAEPNYIYSIGNLQPVGPELTASDLERMQSDNRLKSATAAVVPNDPLYSQQSYITAIKADLVWAQTTGDSSQVIAILDTGVDWTHPDLKNKIWLNPGEIEGNGQDDDGNGFPDDYMGWDFINNDNNPMDDNSHGTHVAGIAAAETNNGIGIAGVNWHAKIMPIKVFPASGYGNAATITQGINYAANNGATVINMSFGGYGRSFTMEAALLDAFSKNVMLVAAAGNDAFSINKIFPNGSPAAHYPSAFSFVFGVQSDGDYSNYDPDGPIYSEFDEGLNYELKAPGTAISTVPNGNYRIFSGTSMASPIVSGAIAMYLSHFPDHTLEEIWSNFIYSSTEMFNMQESFFSNDKPVRLDLLRFEIKDDGEGADNDGKADAGEVIDLVVQVRNTGSPAQNVYVKIAQSNDGDPNDLTILKDSVYFGSIGVFRSLSNAHEPFKIKINENCFNDRTVSIDVTMRNAGDENYFTQKLKFKIYNGEDLSGIILNDTILTPDKNWVITNSLRISTGVTVTILPGTTVEVLAGVDNRGKIISIGTPENRITMKGYIGGDAEYKYSNIDAKGNDVSGNIFEYCDFSNLQNLRANNIQYSRIYSQSNIGWPGIEVGMIYRCYFESIFAYFKPIFGSLYESVINNYHNPREYWDAYITKSSYNVYWNLYDSYFGSASFLFEISDGDKRLHKNTFINNYSNTWFVISKGATDIITVENQYWGTNKHEKIKAKYADFNYNAGLPFLNYEPKLEAPSDSCHAHVWKVLVNGKDAQDEEVDPLGVGRHRFDVYFNRSMKKEVTPQVTFGGIFPYTSVPINEDGEWSEDGKIYTVYKTIKLTNADGINRIRVAKAIQDADWGWEIPVEDQRFSFVISAASSASNEFMATPGLGKVSLEWNDNDLDDGLGYNMYRMEQINDSTLSQPVMINTTLIADTLYTDFAVVPNKKYFYYYKILRTNLSETDSSKVVAAIPFTAAMGDANGDLTVNVLDVTTIVAYLLNQNPQPFIFEAADVNGDGVINVLDIVATVNLVLNPQKSAAIATAEPVKLYLQNDTLFADAPVAIGAIQFDITGVEGIEEIERLSALNGFESGFRVNNNTLRLIVYSLTGKTIAAGNHIPLLKLKKGSGVTNMVMGDKNGAPLTVNYITTGLWNLRDLNDGVASLGQNYPNPFGGSTIIPVIINEPVDEVVVRIININGQEVAVLPLRNPVIGENLLHWNSGTHKGLMAYVLEIRRDGRQVVSGVRKMIAK